jgi:hypothetical protein
MVTGVQLSYDVARQLVEDRRTTLAADARRPLPTRLTRRNRRKVIASRLSRRAREAADGLRAAMAADGDLILDPPERRA